MRLFNFYRGLYARVNGSVDIVLLSGAQLSSVAALKTLTKESWHTASQTLHRSDNRFSFRSVME